MPISNHHSLLVYIEQGRSTTSTTLTFTTASTSGITWKTRVTQIECSRWVSSLFPFLAFLAFPFFANKYYQNILVCQGLILIAING